MLDISVLSNCCFYPLKGPAGVHVSVVVVVVGGGRRYSSGVRKVSSFNPIDILLV